MDISQGELEQPRIRDSFLAVPSQVADSPEESASEDWRPQDVAGVLLGFAVLALVVLLGVVVSLSVAAALLRQMRVS
jgi:hypothetical protein